MGKGMEINVCGIVVSICYSCSGNFWLNIDKCFFN